MSAGPSRYCIDGLESTHHLYEPTLKLLSLQYQELFWQRGTCGIVSLRDRGYLRIDLAQSIDEMCSLE